MNAASAEYARFGGALVVVLLATRLAAEGVNTYVWASGNAAWAAVALALIALVMWPLAALLARHDGGLLARNLPVLAYLAYLVLRIDPRDGYSAKCALAEVIVWLGVLFTLELVRESPEVGRQIREWSIRLVKLLVVLGAVQMAVFMVRNPGAGPGDLVEARPVKGIYYHAANYMGVLWPFVFFFLKSRQFGWLALLGFACAGTGTRSPALAAVCLAIPAAKSFLRRRITWWDLALSVLLTAAVYLVLIVRAAQGELPDDSSRFTLGSLQWRVLFWKDFLVIDDPFSFLFGHGVGTADVRATVLAGTEELGYMFAPHNDYLRLYYDLGIVGELLYLVLLGWCFRLLMRAEDSSRDYAVLILLMVLCFYITDNFMYHTFALTPFVFIASCVCPAPRTADAPVPPILAAAAVHP